jgi:hypothetical protein
MAIRVPHCTQNKNPLCSEQPFMLFRFFSWKYKILISSPEFHLLFIIPQQEWNGTKIVHLSFRNDLFFYFLYFTGMWHAWERTESVQDLVGKSEGKRPLGRQRRRWQGGIRMDLG